MRRLTSSVKAWKGTPSCRIPCKSNVIDVTATALVWSTSYNCCKSGKQQAPDFNRKNGAGSRLPG
ncbi:hypothetical protein ACNKHV_02480 [Shigella flexneri]